jgi:hypothetical protein
MDNRIRSFVGERDGLLSLATKYINHMGFHFVMTGSVSKFINQRLIRYRR